MKKLLLLENWCLDCTLGVYQWYSSGGLKCYALFWYMLTCFFFKPIPTFKQVHYASGVDSVVQFIFYQPIIHRWRETDFFPCSVTCGGGKCFKFLSNVLFFCQLTQVSANSCHFTVPQGISWLQRSALTCAVIGWWWTSIAIITLRMSSPNPDCRSVTWTLVLLGGWLKV